MNNNEQVGQGIIAPAVQLPPIAVQQQMQQQYMTYAETRARLRERNRPIQRQPVAQQGPNAATVQTGRRARRAGLRFLRRAAEDQQPMIGEPQQLAGRRPAPNPPPAQQAPINVEGRVNGRHVRFRQNGAEPEPEAEDAGKHIKQYNIWSN